MLLPPSMQDKIEFMPLGKAVQKPEPVKADPIREFEKHNHDIPGAPKLPRVTPEMAGRALRSLVGAAVIGYEREQAKSAAQSMTLDVSKLHRNMLQSLDLRPGSILRIDEQKPPAHKTLMRDTRPLEERKEAFDRISKQYEASINQEYEDRWDDLFQKQVLKQTGRLDKLSELSKPPALTWPTLPDLPEPTFLPEVVNQAPIRAEFESWEEKGRKEAETLVRDVVNLAQKYDPARRKRGADVLIEVAHYLKYNDVMHLNGCDLQDLRAFFGELGMPDKWKARIIESDRVSQLNIF